MPVKLSHHIRRGADLGEQIHLDPLVQEDGGGQLGKPGNRQHGDTVMVKVKATQQLDINFYAKAKAKLDITKHCF